MNSPLKSQLLNLYTGSPARLPDLDFTNAQELTWDFRLAEHLDPEKLIVNTRMLRCLHRIAGIEHSTITDYVNEDHHVGVDDLDLSDMNASSSGSATLSASFRLSRFSRSRSRRTHHDPNYIDVYDAMAPNYVQKIRATHSIPRPEFTNKIVDRRTEETDGQKWAATLDGYTRLLLLLRAGRHNLLRASDPLPHFWLLELGTLGGSIAGTILDRDASMLTTWVGSQGIILALKTYLDKGRYGESLLKKRRWSLLTMSDCQLDRYLAMYAVAQSSTLVKAAK